jgi:ATP-dependent exoDNAse (exonuclease V) beta subunit
VNKHRHFSATGHPEGKRVAKEGSGWMPLTASQRSAIEYRGKNLQLIACAGSGKTEVVARRVVHLLRADGAGLAPRNIIAFTFTDKAAAELKERIVRRVREFLGQEGTAMSSLRSCARARGGGPSRKLRVPLVVSVGSL